MRSLPSMLHNRCLESVTSSDSLLPHPNSVRRDSIESVYNCTIRSGSTVASILADPYNVIDPKFQPPCRNNSHPPPLPPRPTPLPSPEETCALLLTNQPPTGQSNDNRGRNESDSGQPRSQINGVAHRLQACPPEHDGYEIPSPTQPPTRKRQSKRRSTCTLCTVLSVISAVLNVVLAVLLGLLLFDCIPFRSWTSGSAGDTANATAVRDGSPCFPASADSNSFYVKNFGRAPSSVSRQSHSAHVGLVYPKESYSAKSVMLKLDKDNPDRRTHADGPTVTANTVIISQTGSYFVYAGILYSQTTCTGSKNSRPGISLQVRLNRQHAPKTTLLRAEGVCCVSCNKKEYKTAFTGGMFHLMTSDDLYVSFKGTAFEKNLNTSFFGLYLVSPPRVLSPVVSKPPRDLSIKTS